MSTAIAKKKDDVRRYDGRYIPISEVLETVFNNPGMSYENLAKIMDIPSSTLKVRLAPYKQSLQNIKDYRDNKAGILEHKEIELLSAITPQKVNDASLRDIATSFGIISDKRRLEQGLSTANIGLNITLQVVSDEDNMADLGDISAYIQGQGADNDDE